MQNKLAAILATLAILTLAGCMNLQPPAANPQTPFDPASLTAYAGPGTATITGQAFSKTRGGDVKLGAGNTVTLVPATPFLKDVRDLKAKGYTVPAMTEQVGQALKPYIREAIADANGNFEFTNLPAGEYLVEVVITWLVTSTQHTGGLISKEVSVKDGETKKVILTH